MLNIFTKLILGNGLHTWNKKKFGTKVRQLTCFAKLNKIELMAWTPIALIRKHEK